MNEKVAILIVNGGKDPKQGRWLQLCLENVIKHTVWPKYHLYIWNNNIGDSWVSQYVNQFKNLTLAEVDPEKTLTHQHAVPLQRLYELANKDQPKYIVTLDSDAFPVRNGWLTDLIKAIENGAVLSGVWRDELKDRIKPYVHASCLCTTCEFIKKNNLRFDDIPSTKNKRYDTLSVFTERAEELDKPIYKLRRSNRNQFHKIIGGIYGDTIYHHGAGSRKYVHFWNEKYSITTDHENNRVRDVATSLLFQYPDEYIHWLREDKLSKIVVFILGMHRSGTSCLAGSLEKCGLYLGNVKPHSKYNLKGNFELKDVQAINDEILSINNGSWKSPPEKIEGVGYYRKRMDTLIDELTTYYSCGIKDPRILLTLDVWLEANISPLFVGTFRHPIAVAQSLVKRNKISMDESIGLWIHYNNILVELHKKYHFKIIEFDLNDIDRYCYTVANFAIEIGLKPDIFKIKQFVDRKMDNSKIMKTGKIPDKCKKIYNYLKENSYHPNIEKESFEYDLINCQKMLASKIKTKLKDRYEYGIYRLKGFIPKDVRRFIRF